MIPADGAVRKTVLLCQFLLEFDDASLVQAFIQNRCDHHHSGRGLSLRILCIHWYVLLSLLLERAYYLRFKGQRQTGCVDQIPD